MVHPVVQSKKYGERFVQVLQNQESLGILWHFSGLESLGKRLLVLEKSDNLLNSTSKNAKQKIVVCSVEILN